ncbi:MAG: hypothetical protein ACXV3B_11555, partial [Ilumatobacteraceae bacterium]
MASAADGIAYMNGTYCPLGEASVPLLDPGFTRGDAVYDTVSVWGGQFFRLDDHVARFFRSCATARLAPPANPDVPEMHTLAFDNGAAALGSRVDSWHTDGTFMDSPPLGTVLRAV